MGLTFDRCESSSWASISEKEKSASVRRRMRAGNKVRGRRATPDRTGLPFGHHFGTAAGRLLYMYPVFRYLPTALGEQIVTQV
jgi:hypothetical protein